MPLKFSCANCEFVVTGVETYTNIVGDSISTIIRASLSGPHTNRTALRRYVCRAAKRIWGVGDKYNNWGPTNGLCEGGSGGIRKLIFLRFLHALKCVLGVPEALFHACTQYIYICKLPSSISGFRSNSTTYGAVASRLCSTLQKIRSKNNKTC